MAGIKDIELALRKIFGGGSDISAANPLEVHDPKVGSLISFEGTTTADGAEDGSTLVCSGLEEKPDYDGNLVIITSGEYVGQARDITGDTTGGTVTPHTAFGGKIVSGVTFVIVGIRTTPAEVAAIEALLTNADYGLAALHGDIGDKGAGVDIITRLGAFTAAENLKAILGDLSTTKRLGQILGGLDETDTLKAILGAFTHTTTLKAAIDAITTHLTDLKGLGWTDENLKTIDGLLDDIKAVTDVIPDGGHLTDLLADITAILADTDELQGDWKDTGRLDTILDAIKGSTDDWLEAGRLDAILDDIKAKTDNLKDSWNDITAAAVKEAIEAAGSHLALIKAETDKIPGSGADTQVELDLAAGPTEVFTISTTTRKKVHMLMVSMVNCSATAKITVDLSTKINGVMTKFYSQEFTKDTDPDGIMAINGTLAILADLKVEMTSSNAGDTSITVPYSYILEDME